MSNVFGLDIGTRNVVGTVGHKTEEDEFVVEAQYVMQHETRSMLDGQIHDIARVGRTIAKVKAELESQINEPLSEVCIAAAGRVLKTVTTHIEYDYPEESIVTAEDIHTLDLLGIEKAQDELKEKNDTKYKFYCVGYSVVKYYLNEEVFISLEGHKADKIGEDIIVTFLPEDVVDGLYSAVGAADLSVANMTLEPIAAINVAIPENYRMLNIALVDVGAGTSDICITRDGSIIAYGMIPYAGDELTEVIVQHYLVDFKMAESIKLASTTDKKVTYTDIMSIEHTIDSKEVWDLLEPVVDKITSEVAAKIKELNGDKTVSACFVVGGGGKVHGFTEALSKKLDIQQERVALRGEEVLGEVTFKQEDIKKDPLLVTPIGICLNYYDQKNNFIMVRFNGERIKLYDNNRLTIVDAALAAGFPKEQLFPKRGVPINFTVNGSSRIVRGEAGEGAIVTMNDKPANINTPLEPNSEITITPSTEGEAAVYKISQLEEYTSATVCFIVNSKIIRCPKFVEVNGVLEPADYSIKEGDVIETRNFYTVGQIAEFMDVEVDKEHDILVNNRIADFETLVYDNFNIDWTILSFRTLDSEEDFNKAPESNKQSMGTGSASIDSSYYEKEEKDSLMTETSDRDEAYSDNIQSEIETETENEGTRIDKTVVDSESEAEADDSHKVDNEDKSDDSSGDNVEVESKSDDLTNEDASEEMEDNVFFKDHTEARAAAMERERLKKEKNASEEKSEEDKSIDDGLENKESEDSQITNGQTVADKTADDKTTEGQIEEDKTSDVNTGRTMTVIINNMPVALTGKDSYIFVDLFNYYDFDLKASNGRAVVTLVNGKEAMYTQQLNENDKIELYWKEK